MHKFSLPISLLALFIALGGTGYAALKVGSRQIVNNSVRSKDLRNNDIRSKDIRNRTIVGKDIAAGVIPSIPAPPSTSSQIGQVTGPAVTVQPGSATPTATATCPAGTKVVGGGATTAPLNNFSLSRSAPFRQQWLVNGYNAGSFPGTVQAVAFCAR
jgi:hypothetical protein